MNPMRIGIYHVDAGTTHAGGKAIFVQQMARHLAEDHEVYLYTRYDDPGELNPLLREGDVRIYRLPAVDGALTQAVVGRCTPFHSRKTLTLLEGLRSGLGAHVDGHLDVLLTHQFLDDLVLSNVVDVPLVYQYHNVCQVGPGAKLRERLSATDHHLANSHRIAREAADKLGRTVDGVVPPGVDLDRFTPDAAAAFSPDEPAILYAGRVCRAKGVYELVDAVARLPRDAHLYVAGAGDIEGVYARAVDRGIAHAVTFLGEVPHDELPGYYAACDVFCNPTHYEGFGMTNVEAMACGLPVVTSDLEAIREFATPDESALLVPPGDPARLATGLERVLADADLRRALARGGRRVARRFPWDVQADRLAAFCHGVVESEPVEPPRVAAAP